MLFKASLLSSSTSGPTNIPQSQGSSAGSNTGAALTKWRCTLSSLLHKYLAVHTNSRHNVLINTQVMFKNKYSRLTPPPVRDNFSSKYFASQQPGSVDGVGRRGVDGAAPDVVDAISDAEVNTLHQPQITRQIRFIYFYMFIFLQIFFLTVIVIITN